MSALSDLLQQGEAVERSRPWPRVVVDRLLWLTLAERLADGTLTLLGLWAEPGAVHACLLDSSDYDIGTATFQCVDGEFPSIAKRHPPASRLERAIRDLYGLEPNGLQDRRPWIDHGCWRLSTPLAVVPRGAAATRRYEFLPAEGESLHQIPVGPVHAGIIEPGHFRFTASGETVVRLEERLGYVHKGVESLMAGADIEQGARIAGRISGDSTVAYAIVFAQAVEAASGVCAPPRAQWLRALMAELERLANHFGDIGGICNDAAFVLMQAHCSVLRERIMRTAMACFGHRMMQDRVVPGGVAVDLDAAAADRLIALIANIQERFTALIELYEHTASLQNRTVGTGILKPALARQYGAGGYIGRASNRDFDARRAPAYAPYEQLEFDVPVRHDGDVNARVWIRIREVEQSLKLVEHIVHRMPEGALIVELPRQAGEGMALIEGFRGDIFGWLRLDENGRLQRCHLRDPSWFQWPLLEAAIEGNIVADFPLCNKSFNCSYSGHDL